MEEQYGWEFEVDSVTELIAVGIMCMIGFGALMLMVLAFNSRVNEYERYDKVAANVMYETARDHTYRFTPFQSYIMGYGIDEWSPEGTSIKWFHNNRDYIVVKESLFSGDLIARNNMVSGANNTNPSVRSVLDGIRGRHDMSEFYRGSTTMLQLIWTDEHNVEYDTYLDDDVTVWERNKRDFEWVVKE